jgi:hypothetical protein
MGHAMATMREIAEEESGILPAPLPGVGSAVSFRLRGSEWRNGRNSFAALVTRTDPETGLIDIVVVMDADDFMSQKNVPQRLSDDDWGWEPVADGAAAAVEKLRADFEAFKVELAQVIFGQFPKVDESIYDTLQEHDNRIGLLASGNPSRRRGKAKA